MRKIRLLMLVFLVVAAVSTVGAQVETEPIIVLNEGDLWAWDGSGKGLEQKTFWGYNQEPVLSPDGQQVAYMAWSAITVDALTREGAIGGGEVPGDIKVFEVANQQEIVIAGQPPEASFFTPGVADKAVIRSKPVWSPDGKQLAWTEYDIPGDGLSRIMTYDFATQTTQTLISPLPAQAGVPVPVEITWGSSGIVVRSTTPYMNPDSSTVFTSTFVDSFLVYSVDGTQQGIIQVLQTEDRFMTDFILVNYQDLEYIGVQYNTGEWDLIDPLSGESQPAPGLPELYCTSAPEKSLSIAVWPDGETSGVEYQLLDVDGNAVGAPVDMSSDFEGRIALSPSGGALAYVQYDPQASQYDSSIIIWNNGEVSARFEVNPRDFSFLWGPTAWRIRGEKSWGSPS